MSALASALLFVVLQFGPNQSLVHDQLARRDAVDRHFLPIEALDEISREPLYLVFHQEKEWRKAFYLPETMPALPSDRSLPGLVVPRLYLYRPYYLQNGRLADFQSLAVDTASAYFEALLERQFERRMREPAFGKLAKTRADVLFPEVGEAARLEVYGATLAEFAGHLMSIANELSRARRRRVDLCPRETQVPLLEHWRRAFEGGQFAGTYTPEGSVETVITKQGLAREDKLLAAKELLGRPRWNGDPVADLAVCRP